MPPPPLFRSVLPLPQQRILLLVLMPSREAEFEHSILPIFSRSCTLALYPAYLMCIHTYLRPTPLLLVNVCCFSFFYPEQTAFYFAWMNFYFRWLLVPGVVGLFITVHKVGWARTGQRP